MRVTDSLMTRNFLGSVADLYEKMNAASQQISTGRRINQLHESPSGSAELVSVRAGLSGIDQYRANADRTQLFVGSADAALDSAYNLLTQIFTRGSAAASDFIDPSSRSAIAGDVRVLRDQILALANSNSGGRYLFGGSQATLSPFEISADTVAYRGDAVVNRVAVAEGMTVAQGVPGGEVLLPVFTAIEHLLTALDGDDIPGIHTALASVSEQLKTISDGRARLGVNLAAIERIKSDLDATELQIRERRAAVEDANMAAAITNLSETRTALTAVLAARAEYQTQSLFDFLG